MNVFFIRESQPAAIDLYFSEDILAELLF